MKHKKYILFLICEGILLFFLTAWGGEVHSPSLFSFPFAQIAYGIKALAQTGHLGNAIALSLLVCISAIPSVVFFVIPAEKRSTAEAIVINSTSLVMFVSLYGMMNPTQLSPVLLLEVPEILPLFEGMLGVTIWSWIVACVVFRLLGLFRSGSIEGLRKYLRIAVFCLGALFTGYCFTVPATEMLAGIRESRYKTDSLFEILRYIAAAAPYICNVFICTAVADLLDAIKSSSENIRACVETVVKRCCVSLGIAVSLTAVLNALQVVFMRHLSNVHTNVDIPIVGIAFSLMILLIARLLVENRRLHDDNDLFI